MNFSIEKHNENHFSIPKSAFTPLKPLSKAAQQVFSFRSLVYQENKIPVHLKDDETHNSNNLESIIEKSDAKKISQLDSQRSSMQTMNVEDINDHEVFQKISQDCLKVDIEQTALTHSRLRSKKPLKYKIFCQSDDDGQETRPCQTKNIIKNFMRSLLNFIHKNKNIVLKVLKEQNIKKQEFESFLEKIQEKINTIIELRSLWTTCDYHRTFRILSSYFLRKYYTKHIFHSRISNYLIHLKYRKRLLSSVQTPEQFSSLKCD